MSIYYLYSTMSTVMKGFDRGVPLPDYKGPPTVFVETSEDDFNKQFHDTLRTNWINSSNTTPGINETQTNGCDSLCDMLIHVYPQGTMNKDFLRQ